MGVKRSRSLGSGYENVLKIVFPAYLRDPRLILRIVEYMSSMNIRNFCGILLQYVDPLTIIRVAGKQSLVWSNPSCCHLTAHCRLTALSPPYYQAQTEIARRAFSHRRSTLSADT